MTDSTIPSRAPANAPGAGAPPPGSLVVASSLVVPHEGIEALENAFADRLHAVDQWSGYRGLQVWRDVGRPGTYTMVSWWADQKAFALYMRSRDHDTSHARIPTGAAAPSLLDVRRYQVVAT